MNCIQTLATPVAVAFALLAGCASVDTRLDYERAAKQIETATGHETIVAPESEVAAAPLPDEVLRDGLTADEAVQLCLQNNPRLQAAFLRIGMSRADVVQAGLFSNPTLAVSLRFPDGGGLANLEAGLAQNIADLWQIPIRKRAAERDLDRVILEVAREAVSLASDTRVTYFNAVAAGEVLAIARDNLTLTRELLTLTEARLEAGVIGSLDVNLVKGQVLKAEVDLRTARLESSTTRRNLATLLGLTTPADDIALTDALPMPTEKTLDTERFIEDARQARLDSQAARESLAAAAARVQLELARVFQSVEVGLDLERSERRGLPGRDLLADTARASLASGGLTAPEIESPGQRRQQKGLEIETILGPSLSMTLPIFDQNQAQIAKARFAYREAQALFEALDRSIVQETREAADRIATAWNVAGLYEREVLPQARETLRLSESAYQAGSTPILAVIEAQRSLLETRRAYVAALQGAANALVDLERATARPLRTLLQATDASTQPSDPQQSGESRSPDSKELNDE